MLLLLVCGVDVDANSKLLIGVLGIVYALLRGGLWDTHLVPPVLRTKRKCVCPVEFRAYDRVLWRR